jgi:hypothetical protein
VPAPDAGTETESGCAHEPSVRARAGTPRFTGECAPSAAARDAPINVFSGLRIPYSGRVRRQQAAVWETGPPAAFPREGTVMRDAVEIEPLMAMMPGQVAVTLADEVVVEEIRAALYAADDATIRRVGEALTTLLDFFAKVAQA